jgi:hypothetical protein
VQFLQFEPGPNNPTGRNSRCGLEADEHPFFGQHIEVALGTLSHIADSLRAGLIEQHFLVPDMAVFDFEPSQMAAGERAKEDIAAPRGKPIAGIHRQPRRSD